MLSPREADYPYTGKDGTCHFDISKIAASLANFSVIDTDEDQFQHGRLFSEGSSATAATDTDTHLRLFSSSQASSSQASFPCISNFDFEFNIFPFFRQLFFPVILQSGLSIPHGEDDFQCGIRKIHQKQIYKHTDVQTPKLCIGTSEVMGTPAFPNLGKHCSVDDCKLIDFLPFTCDCCNKVQI